MFNSTFFYTALNVFLIVPFVVFLMLTQGKLFAPYGKMASNIWGSWMISARWGWIIMEAPASIIFFIFLIFCEHLNIGLIVLFVLWQIHYFYRSFIYPFLTNHSKAMPIMMMISALSFQLVNTYFQAGWLFVMAPKDMYNVEYLKSWNFIVGCILFFLGTFINRQADSILRNLRKPGEIEYKIPYGGLYKWVSCPNYLGELMIWLGWAVMLKSPVGLAFFLWTVANLVPRALTSHKWYLEKFADYPTDRKAVIPFVL